MCAHAHAGICTPSNLIQESLFTQPVLCVQMESRFDLQCHESGTFEVENGFCPGLEMSHAHVIPLLDRHCSWSNLSQIPQSFLTSVPAQEVWEKVFCHCLIFFAVLYPNSVLAIFSVAAQWIVWYLSGDPAVFPPNVWCQALSYHVNNR